MRPRPLALALIAMTLVTSVVGCGWLVRRQAVRRCEFTLRRVWPTRFELLRPLHLGLELEIGIRNPNDVDAILDPFDWKLLVGEQEIAHGQHGETIEIPSGAEVGIVMPVETDLWEGAVSVVRGIIDREIEVRLLATVHLGTIFGRIDYDVLIEENRWTIGPDD